MFFLPFINIVFGVCCFVRCVGRFYMIKSRCFSALLFSVLSVRLPSLYIRYFWLHRYYIRYFWFCQGVFETFFRYFWLFFIVHISILFCTPAGGLCVCLACVLCALLRLCGCDRLLSMSVVPSVCPVGSAAVPPGTPTQGATGRPPAPPFSTFRVPKIRKTKLFIRNILTIRNICDIMSSPTKKRGKKIWKRQLP